MCILFAGEIVRALSYEISLAFLKSPPGSIISVMNMSETVFPFETQELYIPSIGTQDVWVIRIESEVTGPPRIRGRDNVAEIIFPESEQRGM